jgi:hypothetical protein
MSPNMPRSWKLTVRGIAQGAKAARVFRLGSGGEADDGRVYLPQPAAVLVALDLPEAGALAGVLDFARAARGQCRGERAGAVCAAAEAVLTSSIPWF